MTDNEIIKALECCGTTRLREHEGDESPCTDCPMQICEDCEVGLPDCALDLINRQKAEIERLKNHFVYGKVHNHIAIEIGAEHAIIEAVKPQIIREFAERLKKSILSQLGISTLEKAEAYHFCLDELDNIVKEMTED